LAVLERLCISNGTEGSNPSLSAIRQAHLSTLRLKIEGWQARRLSNDPERAKQVEGPVKGSGAQKLRTGIYSEHRDSAFASESSLIDI
jgi:hypothetical protein